MNWTLIGMLVFIIIGELVFIVAYKRFHDHEVAKLEAALAEAMGKNTRLSSPEEIYAEAVVDKLRNRRDNANI